MSFDEFSSCAILCSMLAIATRLSINSLIGPHEVSSCPSLASSDNTKSSGLDGISGEC